MAEQLSAQGVPNFLADIKGDLSGMAVGGEPNEKVLARAADVGQQWTPTPCPVEFLTLGGNGTAHLARVLWPHGVLWEEDDWFTGKTQSADTITKFRLPEGISWTERKAVLR